MGLKNTSQATTSTTPNPQALAAYNALLPQAAAVGATPYTPYRGQGVAPIDPEQYAGISGINANAYSALPYIGESEGLALGAAQPITTGDIQQYVNPWTSNVVNSTEQQFANTNAQQQQQVAGNAIAQGAYGGNREAVAQGIVAGQQQAAEAPVISGLESQGYTQGVNTALTEQQAQEAGASNVGALGVAGENAALTGANAQIGAGTLEQQTQQQQDVWNYQQFLNQLAYPFQTTQWQAGIDTGVGSQMGGTSQTDVQSSILNSLFGGITSGAGLLGATGAFGSSGWLSPAIAALARGGGVPADGVANRMPTVPEAPQTLRLQQKQLIAGHRRVQLFPYGSRELPVPHGMSRVSVNGEVFHFNPKRISAADIRHAAERGDEHHLLDLGSYSKHEVMARLHGGEIPVAVVERHPDGTEVRAAAGTHATAQHQAAHMARTMSPGHHLYFEDPRHTVLSRVHHHRADGGMVPGFDTGGATGVAAAPYGAVGSPYGSAKIWIPQSSITRGPGPPQPPQIPQQPQQQPNLASQAKSVGQLANAIQTGMNSPGTPTNIVPTAPANGVIPSGGGGGAYAGIPVGSSPMIGSPSGDDGSLGAVYRRGGRVHHYASGGGDSSDDMMTANGINPDIAATGPNFFGETAAQAGRLPSMVPQYDDGGGVDDADVSASGVVPAQTNDSILVPPGYGAGAPIRLASNDTPLPPEITTGTSGAPQSLTNAILNQESGNRNNVGVSTDNARGPGQIIPQTFSQYAKPGERIDNPDDNRAVSKRILDDYWHRYGGDPARAAVAYFSGPGNVAPPDSPTPWIHDARDGNGKSTSSYVSDVLNRGAGNALGFSGEPGTSGIAAPSQPSTSAASSANGVAPSPDIDWSSKSKLWPSLIMAGGAMMASHSTSPGVALGEGLMAGAQTYAQEKQAEMSQSKINAEVKKLNVETEAARANLDAITKMRNDDAGPSAPAATPKSGLVNVLPAAAPALPAPNTHPQVAVQQATQAASRVAGLQQTPQGPVAVDSAGKPVMNPNDLLAIGQRYVKSGIPSYQAAGEKMLSLYDTIISKGVITNQSGDVIPVPGAAETAARAAGLKKEAEAPYEIASAAVREGGRPIAVSPNQVVTTGAQTNPALETAQNWAISRLPGATAPAPAAATPSAGASNPSAPTGAPPAAAGATPALPLGQPSQFVPRLIRNPDGSVASSVTPAIEEMQKDSAKRFEKAADAYNNAQDIKMRLGIMRQDADQLNTAGWSTTGSGEQARVGLAKTINSIASTFGASPIFDPKTVGSWESLNKQTTQMGFELARTLGSREAMMIVQQATGSVPNSENTPTGFRLVASAIEQQVQRQADYYQFARDYMQTHGGDTIGAEIEFNKKYPPTLYSGRAIANGVVDPRDKAALLANKDNPKAIGAINKKYGDGIAQTILDQPPQ